MHKFLFVLGSGFWVVGGWWLVLGAWGLVKLILVERAKREDYASITLHDWLRS
ncbi:MAG: hypothetical protein WCK17_07880 [Verrucomicrobiota bacterium]